MKIFLKFLVTKEHRKSNRLYLLNSSVLQDINVLSFSLKERQNSARLNCAVVTISKMTSRSCVERNCFKGLTLFFLTTTSNKGLALKEAENFLLKFATDLFPRLTSRVSLFNANVLTHN